jgi:serine/threonine protein kinase
MSENERVALSFAGDSPAEADFERAVPVLRYDDLVFIDNLSGVPAGKQGYVRRARYKGTPVAVKFPGKGDDLGKRSEKVDEVKEESIRYMRMDNHPRVVMLLGRTRNALLTARGAWALVLDFGGRSVREELDADPHMKWQKIVQLAIGCAAALEALHDNGMVHSDVASRNFLVRWQHGAWHVMICDLGLARDEGEEADQRILPATMAPELEEDSDADSDEDSPPCKLTYRSDIYSFGLLLLELVGCKEPTAKSAIPKSPNMPKNYYRLLEDCRQVVFDQRPESMRPVCVRLEEMLQCEPELPGTDECVVEKAAPEGKRQAGRSCSSSCGDANSYYYSSSKSHYNTWMRRRRTTTTMRL